MTKQNLISLICIIFISLSAQLGQAQPDTKQGNGKLIKVETDQETGIITYELIDDISGNISIFDQLGRLVFKQKVAYASGEIDLSYIEASGFYQFIFESKVETEETTIEVI
jgi:hypothetical protein